MMRSRCKVICRIALRAILLLSLAYDSDFRLITWSSGVLTVTYFEMNSRVTHAFLF